MFTLLYIVLFLQTLPSSSPISKDDAELWRAAKRNLAERTKAYLRQNPVSEDLKNFIASFQGGNSRKKRQGYKDMYAIKDGDVVPLESLEEQIRSEPKIGDNYTVVPLIIPIGLENTVTIKDRTKNDYAENEKNMNDFGAGDPTQRAILGRGGALKMMKNKENGAGSNPNEEEPVVESLMEEKLKSTSEATALSKVLEDVQKLINSQKSGRSNKEGALCNVNGYWDSETAGMTFFVKKENSKVEIRMKQREPPSEDGFMVEDKWNVTAKVPFRQSAQIVITATSKKGKRIALFLGECRVCDASETITGDWMVSRISTSCKDQKASHSFFADVFRKNNVEILRADHINKINNLTPSSAMEEG